jgi:hypothetical protein
MYKLSYKDDNKKENEEDFPLCIDNDKKKIIYLVNNDEDELEKNIDEIVEIFNDFMEQTNEKISLKQIQELRRSIEKKEPPFNPFLKKIYDAINVNINKEQIITKKKITPIINPYMERQVFYITGMSGSGKSYYTVNLIKSYNKLFPNNHIYLFSAKDENKTYNEFKDNITFINLDDLLKSQVTLSQLKNSFVIFDDYEGVKNKKIMDELLRIQEIILQQGREFKIYMAFISHLANNYNKTRTILNECHSITLFPQMLTNYSKKYLLQKYLGLSKEDLKKINNLKTRYITILKFPAFYLLHEKGVYKLN